MPLVNVFVRVAAPIAAAMTATTATTVPRVDVDASYYDPAAILRAIMSRPASSLRELALPKNVNDEAEPVTEVVTDEGE